MNIVPQGQDVGQCSKHYPYLLELGFVYACICLWATFERFILKNVMSLISFDNTSKPIACIITLG